MQQFRSLSEKEIKIKEDVFLSKGNSVLAELFSLKEDEDTLIKEMEILIKNGAQVNISDEKEKNCPLTLAIKKGYKKVVRSLVEQHKADVSFNLGSHSPLYAAVAKCDIETVSYLLGKGAKYNLTENIHALIASQKSADPGNQSKYDDISKRLLNLTPRSSANLPMGFQQQIPNPAPTTVTITEADKPTITTTQTNTQTNISPTEDLTPPSTPAFR